MFEIEIHYRETDSFDSYERRDSLGVVLHDLEEARDCLQSAKEHYKYLRLLDFNSGHLGPVQSFDSVISIHKDKKWFDTSVDDPDFSYNSIHTFKFKDQIINSFYEGPCSYLYSMKIIYKAGPKDSFIIDRST